MSCCKQKGMQSWSNREDEMEEGREDKKMKNKFEEEENFLQLLESYAVSLLTAIPHKIGYFVRCRCLA